MEYISDKIEEQYKEWKQNDRVYITAPTGSGKTQFILKVLLPYAKTQGRAILYLVNRKILKAQLLEEVNKYALEEKLLINIRDYIWIKTYQELEENYRNTGYFMQSNVTVIVYSILLLVIAVVNIKLDFITVPKSDAMISRQLDYITISTVFAGFSFTALGLLLGLSSEKLIEKIKNTNIIMDKVGRIMNSIVFFILSVGVSLFFVLGLNSSLIGLLISNKDILLTVDSILYIFSVGYLIAGIAYFIYAVYELYDLVKRVYGYNEKYTNQKISIVKTELEAARKKMRDVEENK